MTLQLLEHEQNHLLALIRSRLTIDWDPEKSHPLLGGLSEATVTRLTMKWQTVAQAVSPSTRLTIASAEPTLGSTVIKVGKWAELAQTKAAFTQISSDYQRYFVQIFSGPHWFDPDSSDRHKQAYLLMEDLAGYVTLYEALCRANLYTVQAITEQLVMFLKQIYHSSTSGQQPRNLIEELYLCPIERMLAKLYRFRAYLLGFDEIATNIHGLLTCLRKRCLIDESFSPTIMHGDLHLRNIMLREIRPETGDIDFRLIDLNKFRPAGDLAYDLGELIVDIETRYATDCLPYSVLSLQETLVTAIDLDAQQRGDRSFAMRLALAKARSLLKLIELDVKQILGRLNISASRIQPKESSPLIQTDLDQVERYLMDALAD